MGPAPLLPHGKYPSKSKETISAEDLSSPPDTSCLPATANKTSEPPLSWEPSTPTNQRSVFLDNSLAIHNGTPTWWITITPSLPFLHKLMSLTQMSLSSQLPPKNTQVVWMLSSPDGEWPTQTSTDSQPNFNLLKLTWYLLKTAKLTGDHAESPTVCNASEETASTADAWETLAVHLSSLTQMMVSPTWLETPPSEPQTASPPPQECGPRTLLSRTGSTASSLPNFSLFQKLIFFHIHPSYE